MFIKPSQVSAVTVSQASLSTSVSISWTAASNNGNGVSEYEVQILDRTSSTYVEYPTLCDGSLTAVIAALSCDISMSDFITNLGYLAG